MGTRSRSKRLFIETSVIVRFLTRDDPRKAGDCDALFVLIDQGSIRPYISNIVVLEMAYVLHRLYKFPRIVVADALERLLLLRNLTIVEKTNTKQALTSWTGGHSKYGDCLIASQVPPGVALVTYDRDFERFSGLSVVTPAQVIAKIDSKD